MGGPLAGSIISALMAKEDKPALLLMSGSAILLILAVLFVLIYVALPIFSYESVRLPASCIDGASNSSSHMPLYRNYTIPGIGTGRLIASDDNSAVVAMSDYGQLPYASTVYLVNKSENKILRGFYFNAENGENARILLTFDNYRGIFTSDNSTYMQTTFEISVFYADGSVASHRRMYMNCTAYGCFIDGSTGQVIA